MPNPRFAVESWLFGALAVPTVYAAITLPGCVWRRLDWRSRSQSARANEISTLSTPTQDVRPRAPSLSRARTGSLAAAAVVGLTALGFALRLSTFDQSFIGDELSTYWILNGHSLGDVLSSIKSDDEITPPLYFILGWLSLKLGSNPDWVRLPSLIAGTATIPLVYLLGARTLGRLPGLIGAAVITLSPFMIYYSVEARAYALMIALLTVSTLALLAALDTRRTRWWVLYAVCTCGAMLSHYTALFPLAAQFAWVIWTHREAIRPLLLANLGAAVGFAPWIGGFIADNNSPTTEILSALSPFNFGGGQDRARELVRWISVRWLGACRGTVAALLIRRPR